MLAVDGITPAEDPTESPVHHLLPDGSFAELSVSTILRHRRTRAHTEAAALSVGAGSDVTPTADEEGNR